MTRAAFVSFLIFILTGAANSQTGTLKISTQKESGSFTISSGRSSAQMLISAKDDPGVIRAFKDLQADIKVVTGNLPVLSIDKTGSRSEVIIAGTIGKSPLIDDLVKRGKISVDDISGKWESYVIQVVDNPFPGVEKGLVIAGSDKRGSIYGIYEISGEIGVSPWYWWADVPARKSKDLFVSPGRHGLRRAFSKIPWHFP